MRRPETRAGPSKVRMNRHILRCVLCSSLREGVYRSGVVAASSVTGRMPPRKSCDLLDSPWQAVVHEHAGELVADGLVPERRPQESTLP